MIFSLSTSWNAFRHRSGRALLFEIRSLGFEQIELSFNLTSRMLRDIAAWHKNLGLEITSVHNYCPIPAGLTRAEALPDCFSMAAKSPNARRRAVAYTKKSIDTVHKLGAAALVLHCGRVEIPDRTRALITLCRRGGRDSARFRRLKESIITERQEQAPVFFRNTLKSLEELEEYARQRNVLLGVENRFYYREIPTLDELDAIFGRFGNSHIRYWHDTGHAQVMEELGILRHKDLLSRFSRVMAGIHLHDVRACQDHMAPGRGTLNFRQLARYIPEGATKVIEAHYPATPQDLIKGREYLERIF